jgi:hypothetical protein
MGLAEGEAVHTGLQMTGGAWDVCEELVTKLAENRQVLMSSSVRAKSDLAAFDSIMEGVHDLARNGVVYTVVQIAKETEWLCVAPLALCPAPVLIRVSARSATGILSVPHSNHDGYA